MHDCFKRQPHECIQLDHLMQWHQSKVLQESAGQLLLGPPGYALHSPGNGRNTHCIECALRYKAPLRGPLEAHRRHYTTETGARKVGDVFGEEV